MDEAKWFILISMRNSGGMLLDDGAVRDYHDLLFLEALGLVERKTRKWEKGLNDFFYLTQAGQDNLTFSGR